MTKTCPDKSFVAIEARERVGSTWDLLRYPGIRSDSDVFAFGYRFRPWTSAKAIAPSPDLLAYLNEAIDEYRLRNHIRLNERVTDLTCSSEAKRRYARIQPASGDAYEIEAKFVSSCRAIAITTTAIRWIRRAAQISLVTSPIASTGGDLDYKDKRVLAIGSGPTAVTLVPAMPETATHVTMLQRSPSYIFSRPAEHPFAKWVARFLPWRAAWKLARARNVLLGIYIWCTAKTKPDGMRAFLRNQAIEALPESYESIPISIRPTIPGTNGSALSPMEISTKASQPAAPARCPIISITFNATASSPKAARKSRPTALSLPPGSRSNS